MHDALLGGVVFRVRISAISVLGARTGCAHKTSFSQSEPVAEDLTPTTSPTTYHLSVLANASNIILVALALLLLLDAGDDPPRGTTSADNVLVRHRQQIPLFHGKLLVMDQLSNFLHLFNHLVVPLGLLGQLGHVDTFLAVYYLRHD